MDVAFMLLLMVAAVPAVVSSERAKSSSLDLQDMFYKRFLDRYQYNTTTDEEAEDTEAIRRRTFFVDPNDPLHAYPNAQDEFIHDLFQTITVYEINNSEKIRKGLEYASRLGLVSLAFIGLGIIAYISPAAAVGRSSQDFTGSSELIQLTSTILESIQKAHVLYRQS